MTNAEETKELIAKEEELLQELETCNKEKDRLKNILGKVGGKLFSVLDPQLHRIPGE